MEDLKLGAGFPLGITSGPPAAAAAMRCASRGPRGLPSAPAPTKRAATIAKRSRVAGLICGLACIGAMDSPSHAAEAFVEFESVPQVVGLGIGRGPDYRGSDDDVTLVAPFARFTFRGEQRYLQLMFNEASANLVNSAKFQAGPVLSYHFGRNSFADADPADTVVRQMRPIDDTVEAGVFGNVAWADGANPRNCMSVGVTLLTDTGGESNGTRARLSARRFRQVSLPVDIHLGAGFIVADRKYNDHYYGVNAGNVGTSGLPIFSMGGGVNEYFGTAAALVYLSKQWVVGAGVRVAALSSSAKDSPLVALRGTSSYVDGGLALGYLGW